MDIHASIVALAQLEAATNAELLDLQARYNALGSLIAAKQKLVADAYAQLKSAVEAGIESEQYRVGQKIHPSITVKRFSPWAYDKKAALQYCVDNNLSAYLREKTTVELDVRPFESDLDALEWGGAERVARLSIAIGALGEYVLIEQTSIGAWDAIPSGDDAL